MTNKKCPRCGEGQISLMTTEQISKLVKRINSTNKIFFNEPILGCNKCQFWVEQRLYGI